MEKESPDTYCIVPNFNGAGDLKKCIDSLLAQSHPCVVVVIDNASVDSSLSVLAEYEELITVIKNEKNLGFAGGVNTGIKHALAKHARYVALFNNDAIADTDWLKNLLRPMAKDSSVGIVTSKIVSHDGEFFDSTGEFYSAWGMPFPRGRGKRVSDEYDSMTNIFGASGCASLYRAKMLNQIGLFDEDFFAYFEDVDISFRAQLAGWKVFYEPHALVRHKIGATSSKMSGLGAYQTFKNLPLLLVKNVPLGLLPGIYLRFLLFYSTTFLSSLFKGNGLMVIKGTLAGLVLIPKKVVQRWDIQKKRKVSNDYIRSIITYDIPPDSKKLRKLRKLFTGSPI